MEQEPVLNAHNKEEYPPMHIGGTNTPLKIKYRHNIVFILFVGIILAYSNPGETILDNCMGSGSTGVACVNTNRNFIGIELDEKYFQIAQQRIDEAIKK